jgi:indole-3-glycerol phosphate synthase
MTILDEIIEYKHEEVAKQKKLCPVKLLEESIYFKGKAISLKKSLLRPEKPGIIAEFKRKSPSKGNINKQASVEQVTTGYIKAGASALSVLTDEKYFGGSNADLTNARILNHCPILRKDFVVDEYQIIEAKSIGADAILLIASHLSKRQVIDFSKCAKAIGLEILLELHDKQEIEKIIADIDCIGVNNRNLKTFEVDIEQSKLLANMIPDSYVKVAESGIDSVETIREFKIHGFKGFLMGEYFMKSDHPEKACEEFIRQLSS